MMTEAEIRAVLDEEIRGAVGYTSSELSNQRKTALEYYYGEKFGNEVDGRSSYVSRDVADTIEWIMPSLMRIFTGGDNIVRFEPQGPEDETQAQQATDYVNYIFQRQNDGFLTLYTWFKDALLSKNGFVKVYWEEYTEHKTETYENLTDDEFAAILSDESVEPVEHSEDVTVDPMTGVTVRIHSLKVKRSKKAGKVCVVPVPPEEVLVNRYPVMPLKRNHFVSHRRRVTTSEIVQMGLMSKEDAESITSYEDADFNEERTSRYAFDDTDEAGGSTSGVKYIWLAECYVKIDVDGDGIAELRKIIMAGDRIIENEECDSIPFVTLTPIILPHKLYGMSIADLVMDLQLLKSTVFRQILDNMYLANNGRYMALDGMVNIDDLLTSRPGGIVRVKTFDAVKPMQPPLLGAPAFNLLEYIDGIKENRTGVNRAPLDPDSISKTATGANIYFQGAQARVELIARVFAETGVKDLFYAILEAVQKHQDHEKVIRLRNEWVPMDPREWTSKFDLSVMVGLGTGSKDQQLAALAEEAQFQLAALQGGLPVVTPENVYNLRMKALEAKNIKGGDLFYTHPDKMPPAPQQPDPKMVAIQAKAETDGQKLQLQAQKMEMGAMQKQQKMEQDFAMAQFKAQQESERMRVEAVQEAERIRMEAMMEKLKTDALAQIEREKMAVQAQMKNMEMAHSSVEGAKDRQHQSMEAENDRMERVISGFLDGVTKLADSMNRPKKVMRDEKGRVAGVE